MTQHSSGQTCIPATTDRPGIHNALSIRKSIQCALFALLCLSITGMDCIAQAADETQTVDAETATQELVPPHINATLLGMSEDGKKVLVRISEPGDKRVKKLAGELAFFDAQCRRFEELPLPKVYSFGLFPFDREPVKILDDSAPEEAQKFRELVRNNPDGVAVKFIIHRIEFDLETMYLPSREVSRTVTKEGETVFEYEVHAGEYVFCGRVTQRWGRSWITILRGIHMNNPEVKQRVFTLQISPPKAGPDSHWRMPFGTKRTAITPIASENMTGKVTGTYHASSSGPIAVIEGEQRLTPISTELPFQLEGTQVHWIPYRTVGNHTDAMILIFTRDIQKVKEMVNLIPNNAVEEMDWTRHIWNE